MQSISRNSISVSFNSGWHSKFWITAIPCLFFYLDIHLFNVQISFSFITIYSQCCGMMGWSLESGANLLLHLQEDKQQLVPNVLHHQQKPPPSQTYSELKFKSRVALIEEDIYISKDHFCWPGHIHTVSAFKQWFACLTCSTRSCASHKRAIGLIKQQLCCADS